MTRLLIMGAGDLGLEMYSWLEEATEVVWDEVGFIDDVFERSYLLPGQGYIGTIKDYQPTSEDVFVCAIADPVAKLKWCRNIQLKGGRFINLIHKTAVVTNNCRLGTGVVIYPFVYVSTNVIVGDFVHLITGTYIGHDANLGDACTICGHCDVTGHVILGEGVFMGTHASIIPSKMIGSFSFLGAGSVVVKDIPSQVTVIGNPAKVLVKPKQVTAEEETFLE